MLKKILFLFVIMSISFAASTATQIDMFISGIVDSSGNPLDSGTVYSYVAGTSTPTQTYTISDKSQSNGVSFTLNAVGCATVYGDGLLKFVIKDSDGVTIKTVDNYDSRAKYVPPTDGTVDLGGSSYRFRNLYTKQIAATTLNISGSLTFSGQTTITTINTTHISGNSYIAKTIDAPDGTATVSDHGDNLSLTSGTGSSSGANGGTLSLTAGNGNTLSGSGGSVSINAGHGYSDGSVYITAGTGGYSGGNIQFTPGNGSFSDGSIIFNGNVSYVSSNTQHRCLITMTVSNNIPNGASTVVTFNSEVIDIGGLHSSSTNTGRITIVQSGLYLIIGQAAFMPNINGYRGCDIRLNNTYDIASAASMSGVGIRSKLNCSTIYNLSAGDYIELTVFQNSGGALSTEIVQKDDTFLSVVRLF